jgi:phosphoglycolate phosphatase-like HAD superfamily hydrolase
MSIGVQWGYADDDELVGANPDVIVSTAEELRLVLGL